jgi:membrane protein implicated in regulation of membrane protease activity
MAAGSLSAMDTGANIVVGGLVIQLLFFGFFVIVSAIFHWRVKKRSGYASLPPASDSRDARTNMTWESVMWALYIACLLILVRSVFRVVEFVEGNDGFIMGREYLLYIFDACLMTLSGVVLWIYHPGSFLTRSGRKRESELSLRP